MKDLTEKEFAEIVAQNGGRAFRVGGCVRDKFMGLAPKDIDFCVVGMVKKNFKELFPEAYEIGKSFPVFLMNIDGTKREVAFARTEEKVGSGYKGFRVSAKPKITIEQDLFRRDTTMNSMAQDCLTGEIVDPYQGREDIKARLLRATSRHFSDDPMRALRLAGHAARFECSITPETLELARATKEELSKEPAERMILELGKVLKEAKAPGRFFTVLFEADLLSVTFTELAGLLPEEFLKLTASIDLTAGSTADAKLRFAAVGLVLDEKELSLWNNRMPLPGDWMKAAISVRETIVLLAEPTAETIVDRINKLRRGPLSIDEFDRITGAALVKVPKLVPLKEAMVLPPGECVPKELAGKEVGNWLRCKYIEEVQKKLCEANL